DAISPHQWNFRLGFSRADVPFRPLFNQNFFYYEVQFPQLNNYPWKEWAFDRWAENIPIQVHRNFMFYGGGRVLQMSRAAMKANVADGIEEESKSIASNAMEDADQPATQMRSNFAETAFFYPMLRTNDKGEVRVEFTLPESLTRWRMIGLAHTGDMDFTLLSNHITARKLMMVQPQLPRFLRVGDEAVLTATVQNLNGDALQGTVFVELTDSTFQQVAMKDSQPFAVEGNSSTVVSFRYKVKDLGPSVVCRIYAQADQFTDGEQRLLPVLSDKVWLTESRAFYLNDDKNQVDISGMMNGGKWWNEHSTMTVETIHNPLGFVVESLGELAQPRTGNAVDLASAYYAATLADWLGDTYPALAEQKAFAVNPSAGADWLKRLQELQQPDGGFSWFKGMSSSPYITRMVVEPFVRLHALGAPVLGEARSATFLSKALAYLDKKAIESYHDMQRRERSGKDKITLGENELHYLYLNALLPHALTQDGKQAVEFFTQRLSLGLKDGSLYDKALACIVYQKMGKVSEARKCLQSLLEYTVYTEELGRYYDSNRSWVNWRNYRMPLQTLLVEALHLFSSEKLKVDPAKPALTATQVRRELCQWLLNQRRTQLWNTSPTVMDALYALLLAPQSELTVRHTDKFYSKTELTAKTASEMPGKWTLQRNAEQSDAPMSWVSISMTTHLPMDEVRADTPHSGLHIERNYYVETRKDGETRFELADLNQLCVGQKVTCRIKIRADRDFDFVEIHNQRAAAFEPVRQLSGYERHTGVGAYRSVTDDETCFFMDRLPKGEFEIAETFFVSQHGKYQTGLATAQGTYCPEFSDHTGSMTVSIPEKTK
ncbi:MAG: hypothetical protein HUJ99_03995, partial [Bacteroidaceae bacterium]|nr:hypothetical protein [Bacteroidaceae bacterium]